MASLSRINFCKSTGIKPNTLVSWETGKYGGLSSKGANALVFEAKKFGIFCSVRWLLKGEGTPPVFVQNELIDEFPEAHQDVLQEIALFASLHPDSRISSVSDDSMSPYYEIGDYVAGINLHEKDINNAIGRTCIVETIDNQILIRQVQSSNKQHFFRLVCTNTRATTENIIEVELKGVAPVVWIRKAITSFNTKDD